jgi:N-acetylmuramoyl-L-alanine amidase
VFRQTGSASEVDDIQPDDDGRHLVVLDPGHGGADPGAVQNGLMEKTITLRAALAVQKALAARAPDIEVFLTREGDDRLSLRQRYRLAEDGDADVFVSLHANAAPSRGADGSEVYFLTLGEATDTESRRIAELENAADLVGGAPVEAGEDLVSILADLQMKSTLSRSSLAAESVLDALASRRLLRTRSVKQARFVVLQSARVPSVLLEMGFLSNANDASKMRRQEFLDAFAAAVAEGLIAYLDRVEAP